MDNPYWAHFNLNDEESDYDEVVGAEDSTDEEDEDFIELEDNVRNEEDLLPQFQKFLKDTFDCT